jgi:hypothetical protein
MIKITSLAVLTALFLANTAHAANLDLDVTLGTTVAYGTGGTYTPNLPLFPASNAGLTLTGDAHIIPGFVSINNIVTAPQGPLLQHDYLGVINNPGPSGTATFALGAGDNVFSFTWGTIDDYNSLVLKTSGGQTYTITGADILSHLAGGVAGSSQANIQFFDPTGSIISAKLQTTQNSFEAANFFEGNDPVPLPASWLLFGTALLALTYFFRRQNALGVK